MIKNLRKLGKTYKQIQEIMKCSPQMISNALNYRKTNETRGRKRKTSTADDRNIVRYCKLNPFASARKIRDELNLSVNTETIRRRLVQNKLFARSPRKVPLLKKKHVEARIQFAKEHGSWPVAKWRNILWSDESKVELFGSTGSRNFVRRPPNSEYNPRFTAKTVKHGGAKIMVWGCFSYSGVGPIHLIEGIMDQRAYVKILDEVMLPYASWNMPLIWVYQQDNDPKHTSKCAKEWFRANGVEVMRWPAQSPDLNPIENLWTDIKKRVAEEKPTNSKDLWHVVKETWKAIPTKRCQDLVDSMPRRCDAVLRNRGYSTKY
uniref:Transposable element Tcb1 transposase n=1 Tax=Bactrocera latifrons TaxID=174628 RepID=A0A0K8TZE2_BACLA